MDKLFPLRYWMYTILFGPLVMVLIVLGTEHHPGDIKFFLAGMIFIIQVSAIVSLPTLAVNWILFSLLKKINIPAWGIRICLIACTITGIIITQNAIGGTLSGLIINAYAVTAFFSGLLIDVSGTGREAD